LRSADFFLESKLLKSIVIDAWEGNAGGFSFSFLQPVKNPADRMSTRLSDSSFFIEFSINQKNKRQNQRDSILRVKDIKSEDKN
jgi:hypothetical protein